MGKTILITGTSEVIGRYLAEYFANEGNYIIGCSRGDFDLKKIIINTIHYL